MSTIRALVFLIMLTISCSGAYACATASKARVQKILNESIRLNEAFKKSADGSDDAEYRRLREQVELYEESTAIPCLKRSVILLRQMPDASLVDALFAHALSHENSADETESEVLATVFVRHGDVFTAVWEKSSVETKKAVTTRLESGWELTKAKYPSPKRQQVELRLKRIEAK